jgi:pSer/pThr/pTyr-binding forkhead associated (FHA) protein
MFALEINFQDGVSQPETIFIRRPQALIGASDHAHVVVEDMRDLDYQIRLVRDLGRRFRCKPMMARSEAPLPAFSDELYDGSATLDLGKVRLHITAIDCDLLLKENEAPDRAGVRVLRQAFGAGAPVFPAVVVRGAQPMVVSFTPEQPIYIGRSKQCALRLDSADISARHARMGYEHGEFWIEDLGSTNGTFVNDQQISGRVNVPAGETIVLGREVAVLGVTSEEQIGRMVHAPTVVARPVPQETVLFPALVSLSQVARPARVLLKPGTKVSIGRDPSSDMWLGAPHISRLHCAVTMTDTGSLAVSDHSTNGTGYDGGVLRKGDLLNVGATPRVFDFGGGVTVGLCFTEREEETFRAAAGNLRAFAPPREVEPPAPWAKGEVAVRPRDATAVAETGATQLKSAGLLHRLGELYRGVGLVGRLAMIAAVAVLAVVLVVVVNLLIPVFS